MANNSEDEYNILTTALLWMKTIWKFFSSTKFLITLITLALFITGVSLLTVGVLVIVTSAKYEPFLGISFFVLPIFAVVVAAIVLNTAALGWYAVKWEKYNLFSAYLALLVAILVFELAIGVFGCKLKDEIYDRDNLINHKMYKSKQNYGIDCYDCLDWDEMQRELHCCGYDGVDEWGLDIPLSCCPMPWRGKLTFQCTKQDSYYTGCRDQLSWKLAGSAIVLGITASTVTCIQGVIIVVAIWIACNMRNQRETKDYEYKELLADASYPQYDSIPGQTLP